MSANAKKNFGQGFPVAGEKDVRRNVGYKNVHKKGLGCKLQDASTTTEDLLEQVKELMHVNKIKENMIEDLKLKNRKLNARLEKLQCMNKDLINFISHIAGTDVNDMQDEIAKLTKENGNLTTLIEEMSVSQDKTKEENKFIRKLLVNYRRKSQLLKDDEHAHDKAKQCTGSVYA
eukprot:TRINITY_DN4272_c0_g3_i1.p2 TRINITY_DN4272_c0_g3~~TRINITY_DN4272_c0_g3_i1.p2  ORF type:complete len:175 (+),score=40.10 TRINITY_DN4272_c0_g3_i1:354-878(+)